MSDDRCDHQPTFATQLHDRTGWSDVLGSLQCGPVITASRKTRRFARGVDTTHLHRQRAESSHAQHQNHHQGGDGECCLDGGGAAIAD